ncbi:MAG: general stress protein [Crocinitomicaceae bacterium]
MKAIVATYQNDEKAVDAVQKLANHHFPMDTVSIVGKSEVVEDNIHVKSTAKVKNAPALIGIGAGTLIGLLSGIGVFAIHGFGFLYGSGAIIGAIGGMDLGIMGGGLATLLLTVGIKHEDVVTYEKHLNEGRFLVIVNGSEEEIDRAENILHTHGTHLNIKK